MFSETIIKIQHLSKYYQIYDQPNDRLKQFFYPRLKRLLGNQHPAAHYKEFRALDNINFEIKKGETVGIIGRNGSGKSTLLQLICGTLNPTSGQVQTQGRIAALLELGSGFNPEFTGHENVYLNASLLGLSKAQIDEVYPAIVTFADIGDFINQPIKTYSSGMLVRLAFAVVAHVNADILIIDEALAVGDVFFTQKCMRFIRKFREQGSVLFVSHDTGAVVNLCHKVIWLENGQVKAIGDPKTISEDYLASFYASTSTRTPPNALPVATTESSEPLADHASTLPTHPVAEVQNTKDQTLEQPPETHRLVPSPQVAQDLIEDPRLALINASELRNTLEVLHLEPDSSSSFGKGRAKIKEVGLKDVTGKKLYQTLGGERVELYIVVEALSEVHQPIVGFTFKDKLGQALFGDNSYLTYLGQKITLTTGKELVASFQFQMPILPQGDYSISAAIASGDQIDHEQEHWIHDALIIKSLASSISTGLVGIPMHKITFDLIENR